MTAAFSTPLINAELLKIEVQIVELGIGLPEPGEVYRSASNLLGGIANDMTANLVIPEWEGQSASSHVARGFLRRDALVALQEIDQEVATVIDGQAGAVMAAREGLEIFGLTCMTWRG